MTSALVIALSWGLLLCWLFILLCWRRPPRRLKNLRGRAAGFGSCLRCDDSTLWKPMHTTWYTASQGCFPLCEECWRQLATPQERWVYYQQLISAWDARAEHDRPEQYRAALGLSSSLEERDLLYEAVMHGL